MSPYDDLSGGQVRRTALSKKELQRGGVMARVEGGGAAAKGCGRADASQLSPGQAHLAALRQGRDQGAETRQCGPSFQPPAPAKRAQEDPAQGGRKVRWVRADAGSRASGQRRPARSAFGNAAALDAGGRFMEAGAPTQTAPQKARAPGPLWRAGAVRRQLS